MVKRLSCEDQMISDITSGKSSDTYFTHDNGGRPFKVEIFNESEVFVYKIISERPNRYEEVPSYKYRVNTVFVGKCKGCPGPEFDGNSLLLEPETEDQTLDYIFIGRNIFVFTAHARIVEFHSPIKSSDVNDAYAIDVDGRYYLFAFEGNVVYENLDIEGYDDVAMYHNGYPSHKTKLGSSEEQKELRIRMDENMDECTVHGLLNVRMIQDPIW